MALLFTAASSQILSRSGASITGYSFSVSALVKPATIGARQGVWGSGVSGSADNYFRLDITAGGAAQARARTTGVSDSSSSGTLPAGTIYQMGYLATSATSRQAVLDGVLATASTTSRNPSGMNRTTVGGTPDSGTASYMNGTIYYVAEWDTTLSQSDWDMLADRVHPLLVRPQNLISFWQPNGLATERDIVGGLGLTPTNSPTKADNDVHLRTHRPIMMGWRPAAASANAEVVVPSASIRLTPGAVAITGAASVAVPSASVRLTPGAVAITSGASVAIPTASVSLTPTPPVISGAASVAIPAASIEIEPGAVAITGAASVTVPAENIKITPGPVVVTGDSATVNASVDVPTSTILLTPGAVSVSGTQAVETPSGGGAYAPRKRTGGGGGVYRPQRLPKAGTKFFKRVAKQKKTEIRRETRRLEKLIKELPSTPSVQAAKIYLIDLEFALRKEAADAEARFQALIDALMEEAALQAMGTRLAELEESIAREARYQEEEEALVLYMLTH